MISCFRLSEEPPLSQSGNDGYPTFSRPDLFNPFDPTHVDPFNIWEPVMTNGLQTAPMFLYTK